MSYQGLSGPFTVHQFRPSTYLYGSAIQSRFKSKSTLALYLLTSIQTREGIWQRVSQCLFYWDIGKTWLVHMTQSGFTGSPGELQITIVMYWIPAINRTHIDFSSHKAYFHNLNIFWIVDDYLNTRHCEQILMELFSKHTQNKSLSKQS